MKKMLKLMHLLGMAGLMGTLLAVLVLASGLSVEGVGDSAALCRASVVLMRWVMVPALLASIVSGMLLMALHAPYAQAGWVWAKAGLGALIAAAALFGVQPQGERSAALAARVGAAGVAAVTAEAQAAWAEALQAERRSAWLALGLSFAASLLGVWRPRLRLLNEPPSPGEESAG